VKEANPVQNGQEPRRQLSVNSCQYRTQVKQAASRDRRSVMQIRPFQCDEPRNEEGENFGTDSH